MSARHALCSIALLLAACASPVEHADDLAQRAGFERQIVVGARFRHVVYRHAPAAGGGVLHVYIEGDGSPYVERTVVAHDPTPHDPLMLRLMREDPAPSVYLGRPCYFGLETDGACEPIFWTLRRFAPDVLDSMEAVLRSEMRRAGAERAELFGHSGGATIAVLLAERVDAVVRVTTIGANLDIGAWCKLHGYAPLVGSLNPADLPPDRAQLEILHFVGERDTNTPPALVRAAAAARGEAVQIVAKFDHHCCWPTAWPELLRLRVSRPPPAAP